LRRVFLCLIPDAHTVKQPPRALSCFGLGLLPHLERPQRDVVEDAQVRKEIELLEHHSDFGSKVRKLLAFFGKGLTIHRTNCPNATRLLSNYSHRVVKTKWAKNKEISFLTGVRIVGLDDVGVINKITNLISGELRININALTVEAKEGLFEGSIKVYVHDKEELDELVNRLKALHGIHSVDRFDTEPV